MGVLIGSGVVPTALCLTWSQTNGTAAVCGCLLGTALALLAWCATAAADSGTVTVESLGRNGPMLAGNVVSILSSAAIVLCGSLLWPKPYDFRSMKEIRLVDEGSGYVPDEDESDEKLQHARSQQLLRKVHGLAPAGDRDCAHHLAVDHLVGA